MFRVCGNSKFTFVDATNASGLTQAFNTINTQLDAVCGSTLLRQFRFSHAVAFFNRSRSSRAMASSRSSSRMCNWSGVSLATLILALSVPASYKASQVLSDLGAISRLPLTSANVKSCSLNKRTASI